MRAVRTLIFRIRKSSCASPRMPERPPPASGRCRGGSRSLGKRMTPQKKLSRLYQQHSVWPQTPPRSGVGIPTHAGLRAAIPSGRVRPSRYARCAWNASGSFRLGLFPPNPPGTRTRRDRRLMPPAHMRGALTAPATPSLRSLGTADTPLSCPVARSAPFVAVRRVFRRLQTPPDFPITQSHVNATPPSCLQSTVSLTLNPVP